jgi:Sel1 repeat
MGARIGTAVLIAAVVALGGRAQAGDYSGGGQKGTTAAPYPIGIAYQDDTRAAFEADRAGNFAEALRLFRKLDAEGRAASPSDLAAARERIGEYYEKGLGGVTQDYGVAASWYEKAINAWPSTRARIRLGFLYANGLGRPQDRAKARELFTSLGPSFQIYATLLDHNLLPKRDEDVTRADFEKAKKATEQSTALSSPSRTMPNRPSPMPGQHNEPGSLIPAGFGAPLICVLIKR